jgi:hypothetical protein
MRDGSGSLLGLDPGLMSTASSYLTAGMRFQCSGACPFQFVVQESDERLELPNRHVEPGGTIVI